MDQSIDFFIFQQDSAPANRANDTVVVAQCCSSERHPLSSHQHCGHLTVPDLNPVDYKIWRILQERVYCIHDVDHLKRRLVEEWAQFDQTIIDDSIKQWRQ